MAPVKYPFSNILSVSFIHFVYGAILFAVFLVILEIIMPVPVDDPAPVSAEVQQMEETVAAPAPVESVATEAAPTDTPAVDTASTQPAPTDTASVDPAAPTDAPQVTPAPDVPTRITKTPITKKTVTVAQPLPKLTIRAGIDEFQRRLFLTREEADANAALGNKGRLALAAVIEFLIYTAVWTLAQALAFGLLLFVPIIPVRVLLRRFADSDGNLTEPATARRTYEVVSAYINRTLAPFLLFAVVALFLQPYFFKDLVEGVSQCFSPSWKWPASLTTYLNSYCQMEKMVPIPNTFPTNLFWVPLYILTFSLMGVSSMAGLFFKEYHIGIASEEEIKARVMKASL